jgi:2',3'-cyclic-nucleotide 2'-phosphodiesterase (5'-nucleotidase family)
VLLASVALAGCTVSRPQPALTGQDIRLTFLHTSDIHSRLIPYDMVPTRTDQQMGLDPEHGPFGGVARMNAILREERQRAARSIWLDSGDCFQGAPIFNMFSGEAELRALSAMGLDGAVVGNHEFDKGSHNLYEQVANWASFPMLAANYHFADPREIGAPKLAEVIQPYQLYDLDGVKIAVIGMANHSSLNSIQEGGNSLGVRPLDSAEVVQKYVDLLRPAADVVVLLSHMGLDEDEGLAPDELADDNERFAIDGVDLILGGHLHIVLDPPKVVHRDGFGHPTVLAHSGAFAKYVGRLDLVVRMGENNADPARRSHIRSFTYEPIPVSCGPRAAPDEPCPFPSDPSINALLQPYAFEIHSAIDMRGVFAYIDVPGGEKLLRNDPGGGDSQLGNLVARAMQLRQGVDADFAMTNSLGIRADFEHGPLTLEQMYNVFPFENSITVMQLSGVEIQETLDFVARRSAERGCRTQIQVAGIHFTIVCGDNPRAEQIHIGDGCRRGDGSIDTGRCRPILPTGLYRVAVNDYMAAGGSGFDVLKRNTSKQNTGISLRDALVDHLRRLPTCSEGVVDDADETVVFKYGPIACLDATTEPHDGRIATAHR